jgi:hypothetical protein
MIVVGAANDCINPGIESIDVKGQHPYHIEYFRLIHKKFVDLLESYPPLDKKSIELTTQTKWRLENMGYIIE